MLGEGATLLGAALLNHGHTDVFRVKRIRKHRHPCRIRGKVHSKRGDIIRKTEEVSEGSVASGMHK
eukprot:7507275-Prorocentrum_lima.AAC.1